MIKIYLIAMLILFSISCVTFLLTNKDKPRADVWYTFMTFSLHLTFILSIVGFVFVMIN